MRSDLVVLSSHNFRPLFLIDLGRDNALSLFTDFLPSFPFFFLFLQLSLSKNSLHWLPSSLKLLTSLKVVRLSHNRFRYFPVVLSGMKGLVEVNLEGNMIEGVPSCLFWMRDLRRLFLNGNCITSLPESIGFFFSPFLLSLFSFLFSSSF